MTIENKYTLSRHLLRLKIIKDCPFFQTSCTKEFREPDAFDFIRHNDNKYKRVKIHRDKSDVSKFDRGISAAKKVRKTCTTFFL